MDAFFLMQDAPFMMKEMRALFGSQAWQRRYMDKWDKYFSNF